MDYINDIAKYNTDDSLKANTAYGFIDLSNKDKQEKLIENNDENCEYAVVMKNGRFYWREKRPEETGKEKEIRLKKDKAKKMQNEKISLEKKSKKIEQKINLDETISSIKTETISETKDLTINNDL